MVRADRQKVVYKREIVVGASARRDAEDEITEFNPFQGMQ